MEETLDDVKLGTNRAASEFALRRLHADLNAICAWRDSEVKALRKADDRNSTLIGWGIIIFAIYSIVQYGWWAVPIILGGLIMVSQLVQSVTKKVKRVEATAAAKIEPLQVQIARHQAVVDAYDFGTQA